MLTLRAHRHPNGQVGQRFLSLNRPQQILEQLAYPRLYKSFRSLERQRRACHYHCWMLRDRRMHDVNGGHLAPIRRRRGAHVSNLHYLQQVLNSMYKCESFPLER